MAETESMRLVEVLVGCGAADLGATERVYLFRGDLEAFPNQALEVIRGAAQRLLGSRPLLRLVYCDDEGDACTLTNSASLADALSFTSVSEDGVETLEITSLPAQSDAECEVKPPDAGSQAPAVLTAKPGPSQQAAAAARGKPVVAEIAAVPAPAKSSLEVHTDSSCDSCNQTPILGKRFKCLECEDYDLCERCHKRNRTDGSLHPHINWVQVEARMHVEVRRDVESAEVVRGYHAPEGAAAVHEDVFCDGCHADSIAGTRYRCITVPNYDLCADCYARRAEVSPHGHEPFEELVVCAVSTAPCSSLAVELLAVPSKPVVAPGPAFEQQSWRASARSAVELSASPSKPVAAPVPAFEQLSGLPALSASRGAAALKALVSSMNDELCLLALEALLQHPDERLRSAAAGATTSPQTAAPANEPVPEVRDEQTEEVAEDPTAKLSAAGGTGRTGTTAEKEEEPTAKLPEVRDEQAEEVEDPTAKLAAAVPEVRDEQAEGEEDPIAKLAAAVPEVRDEQAGEVEDPTAKLSAAVPEVRDGQVAEEEGSTAKLSAAVASSSPLMLGVEATEDEEARGDATEELEESLSHINVGAKHAYRCGRVTLPASAESVEVPVEANMTMVNDGSVPWPESSCISLVHGSSFGVGVLRLGSVQPGRAVEVIFDLSVPLQEAEGCARSAWRLADTRTGTSFGPLIFFEAAWVKPSAGREGARD